MGNLRKKGSKFILLLVALGAGIPGAIFIYIHQGGASDWWALLFIAWIGVNWQLLRDWWFDGKIDGVTGHDLSKQIDRRKEKLKNERERQ